LSPGTTQGIRIKDISLAFLKNQLCEYKRIEAKEGENRGQQVEKF